MLHKRPRKWGPSRVLANAVVSCTHADPNAVHFTAPDHAILFFFTAEPQWQSRLNSDRRTVEIASAGSIEIVPQHSEVFARWSMPKHSMRLDISGQRLKNLAKAEFGCDEFELYPTKQKTVDDRAHVLAQLMRHEMLSPWPGTNEALDSLATVFSIHLLRNYSSLREQSQAVYSSGLSPRVWKTVHDHIHAHLVTPLSIDALSAIAHLSPSHFIRAFKKTTGQTPLQYVISARLSLAHVLIMKGELPLGRIAAATGFSSHSHLTETMRRIWNKTPTDLRLRG